MEYLDKTMNHVMKKNSVQCGRMKSNVLIMLLICVITTASCNGKQKQAGVGSSDVATDNPKVEKAKEDIVGCIKELYAGTDRIGESNERFACHSWWEMVEAVDKKDADLEEIGFFNDDLWTQMQDSNPDDFEVRDIKFQQMDVEKGTALVDFVLWSSIQTVHQKFEFCREDGDWRIHNIIRYRTDSDGKEVELDMMKEMRNYLAEPGEEASELTFANMDGIYDSLDEDMNSESRICLHADGTATWGMIGSLHYTEYTYTIKGHTICMKPKDVDSEEDCYEYDEDTRTLKNEQGAVYYRQVVE